MVAIATNNAYASAAGATKANLKQPAVNGSLAANGVPPSHKTKAEAIQERYAKEREKRLRPEGNSQYVTLINSDKYKHLSSDCWAVKDQNPRLKLHNGMHTKIFIIGGGFGGLQYGVSLVEAGLKPEDIIIADAAGGFGGTWYWNRYPGLMCDVESYVYLPYLEETGYMPKHKYSYGAEIREHANRIAKHWDLSSRGAFQQQVDKLDWNDEKKHWQVQTLDLKTKTPITMTADFVAIAPGLLHNPKLTEFEGIEEYKGEFFHTARWNYDITGGSQEDPTLTKLKGKKVGIIGTGATAIQAVPQLANYAEELYIFQRTPSCVDQRDNHPTDPVEFKSKISNHKGWQTTRSRNFNSFLNNIDPAPTENLVNDGWTRMPSYSALLGTPTPQPITQETVASHVASMHALDIPRQELLRARIDCVVKDPSTASRLKPWYPGWCKRPTFHDEYLPTFNKSHVSLVDTDGKGIDRLTSTGLVANDTPYDLDVIIFSTGYDISTTLSPTRRAGITAHGRNGVLLDKKWAKNLATLHGVLTRDFPNLFLSGPSQACTSANFCAALNELALHSAYIISHAIESTPEGKKVCVEPTREAEEEWSLRIMQGAYVFAAVAGCTPGYLNGEGDADRMSMQDKMKRARGGMWGRGMNEFVDLLGQWRADGGMEGVEVAFG